MIIRTHSRTLFAIAYGILQSREEAEDVVQDSLVKAWKTRWRVRDPEKFPAWLGNHRPSSSSRYFPENAEPCRLTTRRNSPRRVPHRKNDDSDLDRQFHSALAALPELHRAAVTLRYFEEMDYRTIENTLGLTNGALRGILGTRALLDAQTTAARTRLNGLNLWRPFTTKSTTGSRPICTTTFRRRNAARFTLIWSNAPTAEKFIRRQKS